jgi:hypothetical protein
VALDVDLDGEVEYLLRNNRVFALFEAIGGRCTAAWSREASTGRVRQIVGNHLSFSGSETEQEGAANQNADGTVLARRTSAFKEWWAVGSPSTSQFVNTLYTVAPAPVGSGWTFSSPGGAIAKTITLGDASDTLVVNYNLGAGYTKLYVRFGLSPDLDDLLTGGQQGLNLSANASAVTVSNATPGGVASAVVGLDSNVIRQASATDDDFNNQDTIAMRNQAQVQQVEVASQSTTFTVSLSLGGTTTDGDLDGLPASWEQANGLNDNDATGNNGAAGDPDGDGVSNLNEWLVGMNPQLADLSAFPKLQLGKIAGGYRVSFPTLPDRLYQLQVSGTLGAWANSGAPVSTAGAPGPGTLQVDDTAALSKRFYRMVVSPLNP